MYQGSCVVIHFQPCTMPSIIPSKHYFTSRGLLIVTPCSVVVGYRCFRGPCCLHLYWVVTSYSVVVGCLHLQHGSLKRWYPTITHDVTTQQTSTWIITAMKTSKLNYFTGYFSKSVKHSKTNCSEIREDLRGFKKAERHGYYIMRKL
jgi:hypothetical protein